MWMCLGQIVYKQSSYIHVRHVLFPVAMYLPLAWYSALTPLPTSPEGSERSWTLVLLRRAQPEIFFFFFFGFSDDSHFPTPGSQ